MTAELALTRPEPTMDRSDLRTLMDQAVRYVESGLLPASIKTPQQALIIMAQGRELGIPSTVALRQIVVVQGKPTCSAELMLALVHRTYGQSAMRVFKTDNESCTVQYRQQGWDGISDYTFSIEDAKRANLLKNPTWTQYPAAMLRARAISATVRFAFPECLSGLYLPEELGADVTVVDGEVVPVGMEVGAPQSPTPIRQPSEIINPTAPEEVRARAMVQVDGEDISQRQIDEARYKALAENAIKAGHPKAKNIEGVDVTGLKDTVLAKGIASLEEWLTQNEAF